MSKRVAAVFSLGTSSGGCEFALRWLLQRGEQPALYYFFGQAAPEQKESPAGSLDFLRKCPEFASLIVAGEKATDAFSLDRAYSDALEFVALIDRAGYDRVYVGITGATNPMVAALFHAAMSISSAEVIPLYVQGKGGPGGQQSSIELTQGARTGQVIRAEQVLLLARRGQIAAARELASELAPRGRAGFISRAVQALARWDNFEYDTAELDALRDRISDFEDDDTLAPLRGTIARLSKRARQMAAMEAVVTDPPAFALAAQRGGWAQKVRYEGIWLPLDALENARRRLLEGRPTDSVMRSYRAVEVAIQCRLFALGVNPSALDWQRPPLSDLAARWRAPSGDLPAVVPFELGLRLLSDLTATDYSDTLEMRTALQSARNFSYLEHGYVRCSPSAARAALDRAERLCTRLLWDEDVIKSAQELRIVF